MALRISGGSLPEGAGIGRVVDVPGAELFLAEPLEARVDDGERGLELAVAGADAGDEGVVVEPLADGLAGALVAPLATVETENGPATVQKLGTEMPRMVPPRRT